MILSHVLLLVCACGLEVAGFRPRPALIGPYRAAVQRLHSDPPTASLAQSRADKLLQEAQQLRREAEEMEARNLQALAAASAASTSTPPASASPPKAPQSTAQANINTFLAKMPVVNASKATPALAFPAEAAPAASQPLPYINTPSAAPEAALPSNASVLINLREGESQSRALLGKLSGLANTTTTTSTFSRTTGITTTTTTTRPTAGGPAVTTITTSNTPSSTPNSSPTSTGPTSRYASERSWLDVLTTTIALMRMWEEEDHVRGGLLGGIAGEGVPAFEPLFETLVQEWWSRGEADAEQPRWFVAVLKVCVLVLLSLSSSLRCSLALCASLALALSLSLSYLSF